jgi:CubicO group peptidase (beta-lactamase class C family)
MDVRMKPTQSFEDRPRSLSLTAVACIFVILLAYLFSCVPGLEGANPRRPASRRIPFQLPISSPEEQGMDPERLAVAYQRAAEIPRIYSMLVVRHGRLVAEEYFDTPTRTTPMPVASVCKSIVSALVGIALDEAYLVSLDQRMIEFFPEYDVPGLDRRKRDITIRHLVQMRAGYPSDSTLEFFNLLSNSRDWFQLIIVDWPLERSPGTGWAYSNAGTHLLSGILTRATGMSLLDLANRHLFGPMAQTVHYWPRDPQGYCVGPGDVHLTPLQLALFGQMILKHGYWRGMKILDSEWVAESLDDYSATSWGNYWPYRNIRYGSLWWYAEVDGREVHFAWGHGGQFVTVVPTLDLVVVTTADNFLGDFTSASWNTEGAIFRLIASDVLPAAY